RHHPDLHSFPTRRSSDLELVAQLAGGKVAKGVIDQYPAPRPPTRIWVRPARISSVLGMQVSAAEVEQRLRSLGLQSVEGDPQRRDRKSTRLNSSHSQISY